MIVSRLIYNIISNFFLNSCLTANCLKNCQEFRPILRRSMFSNLFVSVADIILASSRNSEFPKSSGDKRRNLTNFLSRRQPKNMRCHYERMHANLLRFPPVQRSCFFRRREQSVASRRTKHYHFSIRWYSNKSQRLVPCYTLSTRFVLLKIIIKECIYVKCCLGVRRYFAKIINIVWTDKDFLLNKIIIIHKKE